MKTPTIDQLWELVCALLASGHYTAISVGEPNVIAIDHGKDWKEDGYPTRFESVVILDAFSLWEEMHQKIAHDLELLKQRQAEPPQAE